jgi:3-hydroxyisobutyrate dehydrogenase-like beta-hydroxyacid dehydrogenase
MTAVGLLGTGRMGAAMGHALASAGYEVVAWNRTRASAERLVSEIGGRVMDRPRDVADAATVVVSMLADGAAVDAVYGGKDGLLAGARPGHVFCDASTVPPATLRAHEPTARAAGAGLLDTPVSGSVALARAGTLSIMVGGEAAHLEIARPVLDALAAKVMHVGPLGSGAGMKLAVNTVIFGLNQSIAEALVLAEATGIDRAMAYEVLATSAVGAPFVGYKRDAFLDPDGTPVAFALELAAKDLRLIDELATDLGVPMPQAATDLALVQAAAASQGADRDFSAVAAHLRDGLRAKEGSTG